MMTVRRTDLRILEFGSILCERIKRRLEKEVEIRKQVRSDMCRLATLFLYFQKHECTSFYGDSADMLRKENFTFLRMAIEECTTKDNKKLNATLNFALYYLIKNLSRSVKGTFLMENKDGDPRALDDFITVLELCKDNSYRANTQGQTSAS